MKPRYISALTAGVLAAALAVSSLVMIAVPANADATIVSDLVDNPGFIAPPPEAKCEADVAIIGTRGSGQPLVGQESDPKGRDEGKPTQAGFRPQDQVEGFGNEVATAAYEITRRLPETTNVRYVPISYRAPDAINGFTDVITVPLGPGRIPLELGVLGFNGTYMLSVLQGAELVRDAVEKLSAACPGTEIVLIGFSQGAHAVHMALEMMKQGNLLGHISAVQLIADPMRNGADKVPYNYVGTGTVGLLHGKVMMPRRVSTIQEESELLGKGALVEGTPLLPLPYVPIPQELKGKVINVCHLLDMVCNLSVQLEPTAHGHVYTDTYNPLTFRMRNSDIYTVPGQWMTNRLNITHRVSDRGGFYLGAECAEVTVIGARGEDWLEQPDRNESRSEILGFGPTVSAAAQKLVQTHFAGNIVAHASVHAKAEPAKDMHALLGPGGDPFDQQVIEGVEMTMKLFTKTLAACPDTKLVLIGYSQGAQILHETLAKASPKIRERVAAVWLLGDTARDPQNFRGHVAGAGESLPAEDDGGQYVAAAKGRGAVAFPTEITDRLRSVCKIPDKGCRSLVGSFDGATNRQTQRGIYMDPATLTEGADWAAQRVESLPLPAGAAEAKSRRDAAAEMDRVRRMHETYGTGARLMRLQ